MAGEPVPALTVPARQVETLENPADSPPRELRKRHRSKRGETPAWEQQSGSRHSGRKEKRQMFWMLVGGASLFALMVAGVIAVTYEGGGNSSVAVVPPVVATPAPVKESDAAPVPSVLRRGEAVFLAEAEVLARRFLTEKNVVGLLPLVRDPAVAGERMKRFYPDGTVVPAGLAGFNEGGLVSYKDRMASVVLRTSDYETRSLAYVETHDGLKIDWESWVGWSEMPWGEFVSAKSKTPVVFRVTLKPVDYYNFDFEDDVKWQSYSLLSPDGEHALYGYAERGSILSERLRPDDTGGISTVTIALKYPADTASDNQVLIDAFITDGWVEGLSDPP